MCMRRVVEPNDKTTIRIHTHTYTCTSTYEAKTVPFIYLFFFLSSVSVFIECTLRAQHTTVTVNGLNATANANPFFQRMHRLCFHLVHYLPHHSFVRSFVCQRLCAPHAFGASNKAFVHNGRFSIVLLESHVYAIAFSHFCVSQFDFVRLPLPPMPNAMLCCFRYMCNECVFAVWCVFFFFFFFVCLFGRTEWVNDEIMWAMCAAAVVLKSSRVVLCVNATNRQRNITPKWWNMGEKSARTQ